MKAWVLAIALVGAQARAQTPGSEAVLLPLLGPPVLASVALDLALLASLVTQGNAKRGGAITTMVFGTVGLVIAGICLSLGFGARSTSTLWTGLSAGALALQTGTIAVGIYAAAHPEPEPEEPAPTRRRRTRVVPEEEKELAPQL